MGIIICFHVISLCVISEGYYPCKHYLCEEYACEHCFYIPWLIITSQYTMMLQGLCVMFLWMMHHMTSQCILNRHCLDPHWPICLPIHFKKNNRLLTPESKINCPHLTENSITSSISCVLGVELIEWMDEWMNEWIYEWINEYINESMTKWIVYSTT